MYGVVDSKSGKRDRNLSSSSEAGAMPAEAREREVRSRIAAWSASVTFSVLATVAVIAAETEMASMTKVESSFHWPW
jgi:hypothetical protein